MNFKLFTDGGSRGNPGAGACACLIFDDEKLQNFDAKYLGEVTNNQAEYEGLRIGLELAIKLKIKEISCYLDSELVVKQLNGEYKIKNANMLELFAKIVSLKLKFDSITFTHIPRSENSDADRLVNIILDNLAN